MWRNRRVTEPPSESTENIPPHQTLFFTEFDAIGTLDVNDQTADRSAVSDHRNANHRLHPPLDAFSQHFGCHCSRFPQIDLLHFVDPQHISSRVSAVSVRVRDFYIVDWGE